MKFNPFAENKVQPVSMFATERPKQPEAPLASAEILKDLEENFDIQAYLDTKMNYETRILFKALVDQVGKDEVREMLNQIIPRTRIDDSGSLKSLKCPHTITWLPELPASLEAFECTNTQIPSLPELPTGLRALICDETPITSLPELPEGLEELWCGYTHITSLPELPAELETLDCPYTEITLLPDLPKRLRRLNCSGTQIISLPELPAGLEELRCYDTPLAKNSEAIAELKEKYPGLQISA